MTIAASTILLLSMVSYLSCGGVVGVGWYVSRKNPHVLWPKIMIYSGIILFSISVGIIAGLMNNIHF